MSDQALTLTQQGWQKLSAGDLDGAVEVLTRAILSNDKDADAKALLGMAYSQKGLHPQAKRALQTAVETQPGNADFRCNLGIVLEHAGELPAAAQTYQQALQINPHHELSRQRLQAIGHVAPPPQPAVPPQPPFQLHPQSSQPAQFPSTQPNRGSGETPPVHQTQQGGTLSAAAPTSKPGHVICARCGQETREGLSCEWCNASLRPPTPVPQQSTGSAPSTVPPPGYEPAVAMAALDARKTRSRAATSDGIANYWLIRGGIGAVSLAMSIGFAIFRHSMRSSARERGTSTVTLSINGQPTQLKGAMATFDKILGNSLTISGGDDSQTSLFIDLPTQATSPSQLAGQTLTTSHNLGQSLDLDDIPDVLTMGDHYYLGEKITAQVSAATDKQVTLTLDGNFREIDEDTGQFKASIPVSGTITLRVTRD